jgi:hypothetical protein
VKEQKRPKQKENTPTLLRISAHCTGVKREQHERQKRPTKEQKSPYMD